MNLQPSIEILLPKKLVGMHLSMTVNADEAITRGYALQSAILSPRFKVLPYEIVQVSRIQ